MQLRKMAYIQNHNKPNYWKISGLNFNQINLVVGKNATGKTRMMNILKNFTRQVSGEEPKLKNGNFSFVFETEKEKFYFYEVHIENQRVMLEKFFISEDPDSKGKVVLERSETEAKILDSEGIAKGTDKLKPYHPPSDKLTVQVRRDKEEYPYLEDLFQWAENYYFFDFAKLRPDNLKIGDFALTKKNLEILDLVPQILKTALEEELLSKEKVASDMKEVGYPIGEVDLRERSLSSGITSHIISMQEEDLECETIQMEMSSGMYRAFAAVVMLHYLLATKTSCTFAIDDLGDGLDYERCSNLIKLILKRVENSEIQVIVTSNSRYLLNAVDVEYWNILEREGPKVTAFNYDNSRTAFEEFEAIGLSNFEIFTGRMYREGSTK